MRDMSLLWKSILIDAIETMFGMHIVMVAVFESLLFLRALAWHSPESSCAPCFQEYN
jgi:hypothetical protein